MAFIKYKNTNNANSVLIADISASATSLIITSGDQGLFPTTYPFLLTLEHLDEEGNVVLREIVKATAGNQNTFTIVRGAGTCVQDDTATNRIQGTTAHAFASGDRVALYWTAEQVKDIQDEVETKLSIDEYRSGTYVYGASTTGDDDYAITLPYPPTAYEVGQVFRFLASVENTGPATLNVNGLGAISIVKNHDVPLDTGDIEEGQIVEVAYDGTNFQMNSQTATVVDMKDIKTTTFSGLPAGEDLHEGDVAQIGNKMYDVSLATQDQSVGGASNYKAGIGFTATGDTIQNLSIKSNLISGTSPTAITVNLESDNNGKPSGTVLSTADIISKYSGNFKIDTNVLGSAHTIGMGSTYEGGFNKGGTDQLFWQGGFGTQMTSDGSTTAPLAIYSKYRSDAGTYVRVYISGISYNMLKTKFDYTPQSSYLYMACSFAPDYKHVYITLYDGASNHINTYQCTTNIDLKPTASTTITGTTFMDSLTIEGQITQGPTGSYSYNTCINFTPDGRYVVIAEKYAYNTSCYYKIYECTTPYSILGGLTQTYSNYISGLYGMVFYQHPNGQIYLIYEMYTGYVYLSAYEFNEGTLSNPKQIKSGSMSSSYATYGLGIWFDENPSATYYGYQLWLRYDSSSYSFPFGNEQITFPMEINFSLGTAYTPAKGEKLWLTIAPTGSSISNYIQLYSLGQEEWTTLSINDTSDRGTISGKSPYLGGQGVKSLYIFKLFENSVPFGSYGIIDNEYSAFSQARFINMGYESHHSGLLPGAKYYGNGGGGLATSGVPYIGTAINETTLEVGYEALPIGYVFVKQYSNSSTDQSYSNSHPVTEDGYYLGIASIVGGSYTGYVGISMNGKGASTTSSGAGSGSVIVGAFMKKGQSISFYKECSSSTYKVGATFCILKMDNYYGQNGA